MHAYLIQAHGNFHQLSMLLSALDDERNEIFVHVDAKCGDFPRAELETACSKARIHFTERISVNWGGPSQIWSELILLKEATAAGHHDYYHLLSGADLPIKSQDTIHAFFDANAGKEFVSFWKLKSTTSSRFLYSPLCEYGRYFWGNLVNNFFKGVQLAFKVKRFPEVDYRYGPNWFSITDDLARYVLSHKQWIRRVFSHTCNCDEIFLQTLIWNSPFKDKLFLPEERLHNEMNMANARLVDWSRGPSVRHPWVFTKDDLNLLESKPHIFARKFDERTDPEIIGLICNNLQ